MGVTKTILKEATGPTPLQGQYVTIHSTGYVLPSMRQFWSTRDTQVFTFKIGEGKVIRGWDEGCMGMGVGESARLLMTSDYAYDKTGFPAYDIPPYASVVFDIEILAIKDTEY